MQFIHTHTHTHTYESIQGSQCRLLGRQRWAITPPHPHFVSLGYLLPWCGVIPVLTHQLQTLFEN